MRTNRLRAAAAAAALLALAACGGEARESAPAAGSEAAGGSASATSPWTLASDPGKGLEVAAAVSAGPKEEEVLVVGRVKDVVPGFAAFTLVDASVKYCGQGNPGDDHCETPWDYCCVTDQLPGRLLPVEVRSGADVAKIERLDVRNLDLVVVQGRLVKEEGADLTLRASGWFRRERPKLEANVRFP
jgi:hypothetical protein